MKKLIAKLFGKKPFEHTHKVVSILGEYEKDGYHAYSIMMDCHVQPHKVVLLKRPLKEGEVFDLTSVTKKLLQDSNQQPEGSSTLQSL